MYDNWQYTALVEFTIRNQQCKDCQQNFATGSWHAVVQVRQRVSHKRTFMYLEQLLLKHHAHSECINIVTFRDGMDFYFTDKQKVLSFSPLFSFNAHLITPFIRHVQLLTWLYPWNMTNKRRYDLLIFWKDMSLSRWNMQGNWYLPIIVRIKVCRYPCLHTS